MMGHKRRCNTALYNYDYFKLKSLRCIAKCSSSFQLGDGYKGVYANLSSLTFEIFHKKNFMIMAYNGLNSLKKSVMKEALLKRYKNILAGGE